MRQDHTQRIAMKTKVKKAVSRSHLTYQHIEAYLRNKASMPEGDRRELEEHLRNCTFCTQVYEDCLLLEPEGSVENGSAEEFWEEIWSTMSPFLDVPIAGVDQEFRKFEKQVSEISEKIAFQYCVRVRSSVVNYLHEKKASQGHPLRRAHRESYPLDPLHALQYGLDQARAAIVNRSTRILDSRLKILHRSILNKVAQIK